MSENTCFKDTEPNLIYLLIAVLILFTGFLTYRFLFQQSWTRYSELRQTKETLLSENNNQIFAKAAAENLKNEVALLDKKFYGNNKVTPSFELYADQIGKLDNLSQSHGVQILSVTPGTIKTASMFNIASFDVEVTGGYIQLYEWLYEVERAIAPIVVEEFEIRGVENSDKLRMKMKTVSYKPFREVK